MIGPKLGSLTSWLKEYLLLKRLWYVGYSALPIRILFKLPKTIIIGDCQNRINNKTIIFIRSFAFNFILSKKSMLWKTYHESRTFTPSHQQKASKSVKYSPIKGKGKSEHSFNLFSSARNSNKSDESFMK